MNNKIATIANTFKNSSNQFATLTYMVNVSGVAARNKHKQIKKLVTARVQVFTTKTAYITAVKNSMEKVDSGQAGKEFKASKPNFRHDDEHFFIVHNDNTKNSMLFCRFIKVFEVNYFIDGKSATKEQIAENLTPSAADKLMAPNKPTYNVKNDVYHKVAMRTPSIDNIQQIKFGGEVVNL